MASSPVSKHRPASASGGTSGQVPDLVTAPPTDETAPPADGGLRRAVGRKMLLLFVLGDILGAGIYSLTGRVAGEVGGAIWLPFLVAFLLAGCSAASYAELVGRYPQAAGAALYTNKAFNVPFLTFVVAFAVLCSGITSASAAARAFGGDYLAEFIALPTPLVAVGFVLMLAAINARGISESVKVNVALTLVEFTGLAVIVVIGVFTLLTGGGNPGRALELDTSGAAVLGIMGGAALAFYALLGFEDSVNIAEEAKEPHRDFPLALFGGLGVACVVYLIVAFTTAMLVPVDVLAESSGPLLEVVRAAGFSFPPKLFALIALIAVTNTALLNMIMASRLVYGMARVGVVPSVLGKVSPRRGTPWVAIAFTTGLAILLVLTGDLSDLASTTVLLLLGVFTVTNICVLVLRRDSSTPTHFRAPTVFPVLGAVGSLLLISPLSGREVEVYARGGGLLVIGAALWLVVHLVRRARGDHSRPGVPA